MSGTATRLVRFALGLTILATLGWMLTIQAAAPAARRNMPLPTDWTHRHIIFSQPGNAEKAARVQQDPRFQQQWLRRNQPLELQRAAVNIPAPEMAAATARPATGRNRSILTAKMGRDWSENQGTGPVSLAGVYPAKFSFDGTSASCASDFVVYSTGLTGSATQANLVAYNNIYSGCSGSGPVPSVYWAYNVTSAFLGEGEILTSPVFSLDGTQIAFVQHNPGALTGTLVLLKWAPSVSDTVVTPETPTAAGHGPYSTCIAPCMTSFTLRSGSGTATDDTTSSVFYDYVDDTAWVGDSQGWLHKFTGVFKGTPAEVRSGGFPVQLVPASALSSPVYDHVSRNVFVGDYSGVLHSVVAATGVATSSGHVDFGTGLVAGPVVDSTSGLVYVSLSADGSGGGSTADSAAIDQFPVNFGSGVSGTKQQVGTSTVEPALPNPMYNGAFDNAYINSINATGNFYVCGNTGSNPTLYQIPINAGIPGAPVPVSTLATTGSKPACSPVTDVYFPDASPGPAAIERLFASVQGNSNAAICTTSGGCVSNFIDTPWQANAVFSVGQEILVEDILDTTTRFINVATTAGSSGLTVPTWGNTPGELKTDGAVTWINQGNPASPTGTWAALHTYLGTTNRILDSNGNVEISTTPGLSGALEPPWNATLGGTTNDGIVIWTNAGPLPTSAFASIGGSSAIIIDNVVDPGGALAGTSQVYFSTLNNQACGTSGTGSCAVQASQAALQ
jgi:hypothetical protein